MLNDYPYLIVGGGMTADAAARAIREADPKAPIGLISAEAHPPYNRPPLSKALWKGDAESSIWRGTDQAGVDLLLGRRVTAIDAAARTVTDNTAQVLRFGKLLLATGGTPRRLSLGTDQVIYYRTYDDYRRLRELAGHDLRFAVIGGGFIGSEIAAALRVDNGIVVAEWLRTTRPEIYAAGDVANFPSAALGRHVRVEHEDAANTMGRAAGLAMAGQGAPYTHLPFFYSDLFELGYEAVGDTDARLETVADWKEPFREGVVYYLKEGRVRGVLLWNTWGQVDAARALIAERGPLAARDLKGRLPH